MGGNASGENGAGQDRAQVAGTVVVVGSKFAITERVQTKKAFVSLTRGPANRLVAVPTRGASLQVQACGAPMPPTLLQQQY